MKGLGGLLRVRDPNVWRQVRIQRARQRARVDGSCDGEARHLAERVDACVRPARARDGDVSVVESSKRILDETLDGHARFLALPPDQSRTVISERDLEGRHGRQQLAIRELVSWRIGELAGSSASTKKYTFHQFRANRRRKFAVY